MLNTSFVTPYICARLIRQSRRWDRVKKNGLHQQHFSTSSPLRDQQSPVSDGAQAQDVRREKNNRAESLGALSRRLAEMTDESIESGGRNAEKVMEEAGFSEELKKRLEARIQETTFRSENPSAFAQMDMPVRQPNPHTDDS